MRQVISRKRIVDNSYVYVAGNDVLPEHGDLLLPLERWQLERAGLKNRGDRIGVVVTCMEDVETIAPDLGTVDLIAIEFPKFTDGRGYSLARLLRERLGFPKELRAIGDVLQDQLYFMARCGFDSFELNEGQTPRAALQAFSSFSTPYQYAVDGRYTVREARHSLGALPALAVAAG